MTLDRMARTANDRFKRGGARSTGLGLLVAVALHALLFALVSFDVRDLDAAETAALEIVLPPEADLPPPPDEIPRPAAPRLGDMDLTDATIPRTEWDEFEDRQLLPPRPPSAGADRPRFIPYDTEPVLQNREEVTRLLRGVRPPTEAESRVELWLYVNADGHVERSEVKTSSGSSELDEAALRVAGSMLFSPAMNMDRPTSVWVSQWVSFRVR